MFLFMFILRLFSFCFSSGYVCYVFSIEAVYFITPTLVRLVRIICVVVLDLTPGFRYDANCPPYFVDDLELCAIKYFYSQRTLLFHTDNDLVAMTTDPAGITDACR